MQVSYKTLVVTRSMKIKHNKNRVVSVVSFTQLRPLTDIVSHQCVLQQTHKKLTFLFQVLVQRRSLFFNFLASTSIFFLSGWKHIFLGRALSRSHKLFPLPLDYFFGCVLEETHGTINLEVERKCEIQDRNL